MGTIAKTRKKNKNGYKNDVIIPIQSLCNLIGVKIDGKEISGLLVNINRKNNSAIVKFRDQSSSPLYEAIGANVIITDDRTQNTAAAVSPTEDDDENEE